MPSLSHVMSCAVVFTVFFTCVGYAAARRVLPDPSLSLAVAPALGWALFNAAALPLFLVSGFRPLPVAIVCGLAILLTVADAFRHGGGMEPGKTPRIPRAAYATAVLTAVS